MNAKLAPLAAVVQGEPADGQLNGSYEGYAVAVWPHSGHPITYLSNSNSVSGEPASVNMLRVTFTGVAGSQPWHCQSSAGGVLHDFASQLTAGPLLKGFKPGEFKFEGVDVVQEANKELAEKFVKRLGIPVASDAETTALQQRLIAAGLFDVLEELRFGGHPFLPKAQFFPGARELTEQVYVQSGVFARVRPAVEERLHAAGLPDFQSLLEAKMHQAEEQNPGRLELDIEAGSAEVPAVAPFREVLDHGVRIAQINAEVNQPRA